MDVRILKDFSTVIGKSKVSFKIGKDTILRQVIDDYNLVEKGLVEIVEKKPTKET